jgi:hypothetical protein
VDKDWWWQKQGKNPPALALIFYRVGIEGQDIQQAIGLKAIFDQAQKGKTPDDLNLIYYDKHHGEDNATKVLMLIIEYFNARKISMDGLKVILNTAGVR